MITRHSFQISDNMTIIIAVHPCTFFVHEYLFGIEVAVWEATNEEVAIMMQVSKNYLSRTY